MWKNLEILFRKLVIIYQAEVRNSSTGYIQNNRAQWDSRSHYVKFNFRKRLTSFSLDLAVVSLVLIMLTLVFYR